MSTNPFEPPQYNFNQPPQQPQYYNYAPQQPPQNNLAVGALVCGILGMVFTILNAIAGAMLQIWQMENQGQNPFGP